MLAFVFVVASLNFVVGYALGAGWSAESLLDFLPKRGKKPQQQDADEPALSRPAAPPTPVASQPKPAPEPQPAAKPKPKPADVMASLVTFREKLTTANVELKLSQEDPERFAKTATRLQEVNHVYLEEAEGAIKHLEELGAAGDAVASATCAAVSQGAETVAAISTKIDGLIESGLKDAAARSQLIEQSTSVRQAAKQAEEQAVTSVASVERKAPDSAPSSFADLDAMFDRLETLLAATQDESVRHVAAVRVDPLAEADGDDTLVASIERAVSEMARTVLGESQLLVPGPPAMLLLEGDSFDQAAERIERLRQQVEATTFELDGRELQATVTCALVDTRKGDGRDQVVDQINQALEESIRMGSNRTFHHDGAFAVATPEIAVKVKPQSVMLR